MCVRKGYILTLGYERGAIWVKKNWYILKRVRVDPRSGASRIKLYC